MKVCVHELSKLPVTCVVIESVDLSLYIAHARIADEEHVIADRQGKVIKTRNLLEMQRAMRKAVSCELFLRQRSAYDEMVGHNYQATDNSMELPLGKEPLPEWLN
jgi:regulator of RNase E activity RraA